MQDLRDFQNTSQSSNEAVTLAFLRHLVVPSNRSAKKMNKNCFFLLNSFRKCGIFIFVPLKPHMRALSSVG